MLEGRCKHNWQSFDQLRQEALDKWPKYHNHRNCGERQSVLIEVGGKKLTLSGLTTEHHQLDKSGLHPNRKSRKELSRILRSRSPANHHSQRQIL